MFAAKTSFLLKNTLKKTKIKKKTYKIYESRYWSLSLELYFKKKILIDPSNNILVCRATLITMSYFLEKSMEFATFLSVTIFKLIQFMIL